VWYGSCTAQDRKDWAQVVRTAQGWPLPDLASIYADQVQRRARCIAADHTHLGNGLFVRLPSAKRYRNMKICTTRLKDNLFPRAVKSVSPAVRQTSSTPEPARGLQTGGLMSHVMKTPGATPASTPQAQRSRIPFSLPTRKRWGWRTPSCTCFTRLTLTGTGGAVL